jgi:TolA-binding protein
MGWLKAIPLSWRIGSMAVLAVTLWFGWAAYKRRLVEQGRQDERVADVERGKENVQELSKDVSKRIGEIEKEITSLGVENNGLRQSSVEQARQIERLKKERDDARLQIERMPDAQVPAAFRAALGVETDPAKPIPTIQELRVATTVVKTASAAADILERVEKRLDDAEKREANERVIAAGQAKKAAQLSILLDAVFVQYGKAYDAIPRRRSLGCLVGHVVTLGMKCKKKKFDVPSPAELRKAAGDGAE